MTLFFCYVSKTSSWLLTYLWRCWIIHDSRDGTQSSCAAETLQTHMYIKEVSQVNDRPGLTIYTTQLADPLHTTLIYSCVITLLNFRETRLQKIIPHRHKKILASNSNKKCRVFLSESWNVKTVNPTEPSATYPGIVFQIPSTFVSTNSLKNSWFNSGSNWCSKISLFRKDF